MKYRYEEITIRYSDTMKPEDYWTYKLNFMLANNYLGFKLHSIVKQFSSTEANWFYIKLLLETHDEEETK